MLTISGIKISKASLALAMLIEHPTYTDIQIAALVGCSRQNLYMCQRYRLARRTLKSQRFNRGTGFVDCRTGGLEVAV